MMTPRLRLQPEAIGMGMTSQRVRDRLIGRLREAGISSERVLNGHMWSMYGLWDYWMMNGHEHPDAERLWRGALRTLEATALPGFRNPGWSSYYSLWQRKLGHTYHQHHQQQFLMLYRMSHDPV